MQASLTTCEQDSEEGHHQEASSESDSIKKNTSDSESSSASSTESGATPATSSAGSWRTSTPITCNEDGSYIGGGEDSSGYNELRGSARSTFPRARAVDAYTYWGTSDLAFPENRNQQFLSEKGIRELNLELIRGDKNHPKQKATQAEACERTSFVRHPNQGILSCDRLVDRRW